VLTALPHIRDGKVRVLATTGLKRSEVLPDVPTVDESGVPGFEAGTWFGIYAPAKTPQAIVDKLNTETLAAIADPAIQKRLKGLGVDIIAKGPKELGDLTKSDLAKWGPIVQKAGVKLD
jgi:tripartite-type tricarboxylate transporter receptor subunit TctC